MTNQQTIRELVEGAVQREINAQRAYSDLAGKVNDDAARDALQGLVKQEKSHQEILERYLRGELGGGMLGRSDVADYKIAERFEQTQITPDMELKEVFLLAANREKASYEFYLQLSKAHPEGEVKSLLERIADEELGHKHKMEFLYNEVAFPQTAGG